MLHPQTHYHTSSQGLRLHNSQGLQYCCKEGQSVLMLLRSHGQVPRGFGLGLTLCLQVICVLRDSDDLSQGTTSL
uniref:Uncharacterized protein n=1 Tax=Arcella intermedia TaxID=1963864 RepID=A0A6B2LSQ7_9EUKA